MALYLNGQKFGPIALNGNKYTAVYKDGVRYPLFDVEFMYQIAEKSEPVHDWIPLISGKSFVVDSSVDYLLIMVKDKIVASMLPFDASGDSGGPWLMGPTSPGTPKYDYSFFCDSSLHLYGGLTYTLKFTDGTSAQIAINSQGTTITPIITL